MKPTTPVPVRKQTLTHGVPQRFETPHSSLASKVLCFQPAAAAPAASRPHSEGQFPSVSVVMTPMGLGSMGEPGRKDFFP